MRYLFKDKIFILIQPCIPDDVGYNSYEIIIKKLLCRRQLL